MILPLDNHLLLWIHFGVLIIHQFEEYIYPGGFRKFYNNHIYNKSPFTKSPLSVVGAVVINIFIAWPVYVLSAIYAEEMIWLAIGLAFITLTNGLLHTFLFFKLKKYNPGFFSGLFLFLPFGIFLLSKLFQIGDVKMLTVLPVLLIAIIVVPLFVFLTSERN